MLTVTLLGTSALVPLPDRAETAAQLNCGGHSILFDCGEGTQTAARKAGVSLFKTDIIALTHYHGDHVFGLPGLLQTLQVLGRTEPLTIVGPGEIREELHHILGLSGWLTYGLKLVSLPPEGLELGSYGFPAGARLVSVPTAHRCISQGYAFLLPRAGKFLPEKARALGIPVSLWSRLQRGEACGGYCPEAVMDLPRKGLKVVFSGDTSPCAALTQAARDADLLLCEATYGEDGQAALAAEHGHMTFSQAGDIAAEANVRRLWLMHFSQRMENPEEFLPNAAARFPDAECGFDGKTITLRFVEGE